MLLAACAGPTPAAPETIPYLPLLELLRHLFGITEQDGAREARQKIAGELALLDDGFADDRALVLDFLGVGDPKAPVLQLEPAVRQRRLFTFLRRLIQLRTAAEPIVLLIDDLHWIDPGSDLFVAQIVEAVSATRTLLLVNFRPEYQADWTRKSWVLQLPMAPLGPEALAELVRDWVGSSPSVAALPELVGARSGGNPFFAEELVLTLLAAEIIYERSIYPVAEYAFKHPLTHEVALGAQLTAARRARHAAVAEAIAAIDADRLDEHAGLLAHHWGEAGEALRAATWHVRAAHWVRANDLAASRRHWTQARKLLVALPDSSERTQLLLEAYPELIDTLDRLGAEPAESEAVYLEAIDVARRAGDRHTEGLVEAAYAYLQSGQNEWTAVIEHATRAVTLADAESDRPVQLFARHALGRGFHWQGRLHEAVGVYDQVAEIGGGDAGVDVEVLGSRPYVECLSLRAMAYGWLGRFREGREFLERVPALLRGVGARSDLSSPAADHIWTCWPLGDADRAREVSSEALQMAERFGADRNVVYALLACGVASCLALRWEEADGFFERAQQRISTTGACTEWSNVINGYQALCWAGMGDHERSLGLALRAVEQARADALDLLRLIHGTLRARVLRMIDGRQHQRELEAQIAEALDLVQRTDMKAWLPLLLLERAGLARMRGDADGMARDLAEARRLFAEMGITGWGDYARSIEA